MVDSASLVVMVWYGGVMLGVIVFAVCICFKSGREGDGEGPPPIANWVELEAARQMPMPFLYFPRILQLLDNVTYTRRRNAATSQDSTGGSSGGGAPLTAVKTTTSTSVSEDCAICLGQFEDGDRCSVMPVCRHEFHRDCIAGWLMAPNNTCPLCRALLQWSLVALDMV